jgi:hypothetical protein
MGQQQPGGSPSSMSAYLMPERLCLGVPTGGIWLLASFRCPTDDVGFGRETNRTAPVLVKASSELPGG